MIEKDLAQAYISCEHDLIRFNEVFLPSENMCEPAPFHRAWSDTLLHDTGNSVWECFRESAKSTLVIRAHILHRLVYPKKDCSYIMFIKANQDVASKTLKMISKEYLANPYLSANMVQIEENSSVGFEVVVLNSRKEPITVRIEAYGKGSSGIRGALYKDRRPDLVIIDDPQDTADSQSETTLESDFEWFSSDIKFLGKFTRIFMIGNNLGAKCLIERVIAGADFFRFKVNKIPIMDSEGRSAWPSRYKIEDILAERDAYKAAGKIDVWFRERMCIANSPESQLFALEDFRYFDEPQKNLSIYVTVDLAISQKSTADYTAIVVNGVDKDDNWFILEIQYGRWQIFETIDNIFRIVSKYRPIYVGVEKVAFQAVLRPLLEKEMTQKHIYFVVKDLLAEKKKELRIEGLQPRFKTGKVWFKSGALWLTEAEAEFLACTREGSKGLHDDIPDAMAYMEQIALAPSGQFDDFDEDDVPFAGGL